MTALQGCVQAKGSGGSCALADITNRIGTTTGGATGDGRWVVGTASLTVTSGTAAPTFSGTINVVGIATADTNLIAIAMFPTATGVIMRCSTTSLTPPGSTTGDPC